MIVQYQKSRLLRPIFHGYIIGIITAAAGGSW
jgi:hypothetical protein